MKACFFKLLLNVLADDSVQLELSFIVSKVCECARYVNTNALTMFSVLVFKAHWIPCPFYSEYTSRS